MFRRRQLALLYFWLRFRQKKTRRYYIRPAHVDHVNSSFALFERYYQAGDPNQLRQFCRFSPQAFDALFQQIERQLPLHARKHRRPITKRQRLIVFLR